jgi:polyhydroxyalkanoate synthesis regulator phasin
MLADVRKNVREMVEVGVAAVSGALTPSRARDMARSLTRGEGMEQVNRVAQDLLEWSQRSREWVAELVQREVKRQLSAAGIATREDLDALRKRVRDLERSSGASSKSGAKRATAKKGSTAKKSGAKAGSGRTPAETVGEAQASPGLGDPAAPAP